MEILRTPESNFETLPAFGFDPQYCTVNGLRMHYLDVGERTAPVALCLHGQPTWSYLYRKMIPAFIAAGYRVVAPDFFGFGRSDKPIDEKVYTFDFHRTAITALIGALDLRSILLVCQDWGGLIGLTIPMEMPERFDRLLVMNTTLGTGDVPLGDGFLSWRSFCNSRPDMDIAALMKRSIPSLTDAEAAAFAAPFPNVSFKAGVRRFPNLVPDRPDAPGAATSRRARDFWSNQWRGKTFMAIGMQDPVLGPNTMNALHAIIRNCPAPMELQDAGHFVQETGSTIVVEAFKSFTDSA